MTWTAPDYDNDEAMAALGRVLIDMTIASRNRYGRDVDGIRYSLLNEIDEHIEAAEADDDERDDGDEGDDGSEIEKDTP